MWLVAGVFQSVQDITLPCQGSVRTRWPILVEKGSSIVKSVLVEGRDDTGIRGVLKIALALLGMALGYVAWVLAFNAVTGHMPRAYESQVLPEDGTVEIARSEFTVPEVAARFRPSMSIALENETPPLLEITYEVIDNSDVNAWTVVYYFVWEDEIHPNPLIDRGYRLYRAARYGYPARDIEYAQVDVDKTTGAINKIQFEGSPDDDYSPTRAIHLREQYELNADGSYDVDAAGPTVVVDMIGQVEVPFEGEQVRLAAKTWNHLSRLAVTSDQLVEGSTSAPLRYLTAAEYEDVKYVRKGSGDFSSSEPRGVIRVGKVVSRIYVILCGAVLVLLIVRIFRTSRGRR